MNINISNTTYSYHGYDIQIDNEIYYSILASTGWQQRRFYSKKTIKHIEDIILPYLNNFAYLFSLENENIFCLELDEDFKENMAEMVENIKNKKVLEIEIIEEKLKILNIKISTTNLSRFSFLKELKYYFKDRILIY